MVNEKGRAKLIGKGLLQTDPANKALRTWPTHSSQQFVQIALFGGAGLQSRSLPDYVGRFQAGSVQDKLLHPWLLIGQNPAA